jgi:hypothetical protein
MRKQVSWLVLAVATAALGACASQRLPSPHKGPELGSLPPDPTQACADWRWIAVLSHTATACPAIPGWTVKPLFGRPPVAKCLQDPQPADPKAAAAAIAELERFCVYEVADALQREPLEHPPAVHKDIVRFDRDCAAMAIASHHEDGLPDDWKSIAAAFLARSGIPSKDLEIKNQRGVRLAFLDTQPTGDFHRDTPPGYSLHGYTMAHIARRLICSPAESEVCAARITTRLALPVGTFDPKSRANTVSDTGRGGHLGMQSDLAAAIEAEVSDWIVDRDEEEAKHLVLNLSLAWDPTLFDGLSEGELGELKAGTQAVYRALQYATTQGALVLAASGNFKNCPGKDQLGPMLPAAWEAGAPESCGESPPRVYAVGGLGVNGEPLWNARERSMPRRVALAEQAVVPTWDADHPSAMYTGSSVATAVASAIAAIVWDTVPSLTGPQVMTLLDADTTRNQVAAFRADFWPGVPDATLVTALRPAVHRLSLCDALDVACHRSDAVNCPLRGECPRLPEYVVDAHLAREPPADSRRGGHFLPTTCQPWIYPQPEVPPCPNCGKEPP